MVIIYYLKGLLHNIEPLLIFLLGNILGDAEIFENLNKVINYSFSPQIHIHTKHLHATYLITVEIYYFTGMVYKDDNSGELCLLFYFMRMYTKYNGNAWKN